MKQQETEHLRQQQIQHLQQLQILQQLGAIGNALSGATNLGNINVPGSTFPLQPQQQINQKNNVSLDESTNAPMKLASMGNTPSFLNANTNETLMAKENGDDDEDDDDPEALQEQMAKLQKKLEKLKNKKKEAP